MPAMSQASNSYTTNSSTSSSTQPRPARFREEMDISTNRLSVLEHPRGFANARPVATKNFSRPATSTRGGSFEDFVPQHQLGTMKELDAKEKEKHEHKLKVKAKEKAKDVVRGLGAEVEKSKVKGLVRSLSFMRK